MRHATGVVATLGALLLLGCDLDIDKLSEGSGGTGGSASSATGGTGWNFVLEPAVAFANNPDLTYRVEFGGATAISLDCSDTGTDCIDANTLWTITDNALTSVAGPDALYKDKDPNCAYAIDYDWTLNDMGEAAIWQVRGTVRADGMKSDCTTLEAEHVANSTNGFALIGCKISYDVYLDFVSIVPPS